MSIEKMRTKRTHKKQNDGEVVILPSANWSAGFIQSVYNILAASSLLLLLFSLDAIEIDAPLLHVMVKAQIYIVAIPIFFLMLILNLADWKHNQLPAGFRAKSVSDEINKTKKIINEISDFDYKEHLTETISKVETKYHSHRAAFFQQIYSAQVKVDLKLGEEIILRKAMLAKTILEGLKQEGLLDDTTRITCPKFLNPMRSFLPYESKECSFPSKLRYINYSILLNLIPLPLSGHLAKKYALDQTTIMIATISLALLTGLACVADSYYFNQRNIRLKLQGFSVIQRPYYQWPPTCIGRQFTNKWAFYPNNSIMREALAFILRIEQMIPDIQVENLPEALRDAVTQFTERSCFTQIDNYLDIEPDDDINHSLLAYF